MTAVVGDRIELIEMPNDPDPIPPGSRGTVTDINDTGYFGTQITVSWDDGRGLMLIEGTDIYRVLDENEEP